MPGRAVLGRCRAARSHLPLKPPSATRGGAGRPRAGAGERTAQIWVKYGKTPLRQSRCKLARIGNVCCSGILKG